MIVETGQIKQPGEFLAVWEAAVVKSLREIPALGTMYVDRFEARVDLPSPARPIQQSPESIRFLQQLTVAKQDRLREFADEFR